MGSIETLLRNIDESISGKADVYKSIHNDLTPEQIVKIKDELKEIKSLLKQAKEEFNLEPHKHYLSHIISTNSDFIWSIISDLWSYKMEKSYGKISSKEKKDKLDNILKKLLEHNAQIQKLIGR